MDFPTFFHSCYSHMFLVDDDECVCLVPPNQQDWQFSLYKDKTRNNVWHVSGTREFEEVHMIYEKIDDMWIKTE